MIFQIKSESNEVGLLKVVECLGNTWSPESYGDIISKSLKLFSEIGEADGWDVDDLDDFVEFNNLRNVLILEHFFIVDEIQFYQ
jgi:hypothetical protein